MILMVPTYLVEVIARVGAEVHGDGEVGGGAEALLAATYVRGVVVQPPRVCGTRSKGQGQVEDS